MVQFCTKCGTKLDDDDKFCTNCGQRTGNYRKINKRNKNDIKRSKKVLKEYAGGLRLTDSYQKKLKEHHQSIMNGIEIKQKIDKEIDSGTLSAEDVEMRFEELMVEYEKNNQERKIQNQKKVEEMIRTDIFKDNRVKYVETIVQNSYPNMELESFEKKVIRDIKLKGPINEMELELKNFSKRIIKNHERIGNYDFACSLLEEGGYRNKAFVKRKHKNLEKEKDLETYVFIRLMDNKLETFGSKIYPKKELLPRTNKESRDRTIFFNEISNIVFESRHILLNLQNREKIRLVSKDYTQSGKEKEQKFRELLNEKWMNYKENESQMAINNNDQEDINPADELVKIAGLYEKGLLTEEEFTAMKKKLFGL